jgi:hypothetical protein
MLRRRYPDANSLTQRQHWDETTRHVVLDRVYNVPGFVFFDAHERGSLEALCARVIPQSYLPPDRRVPIAPWIDARCAGNHGDGTRMDDLPPHNEAWRLGLRGLDQSARALFGEDTEFSTLSEERQHTVLDAIRHGAPPGDVWQRMPSKKWWIVVALRQITGVYYAHPYAWDEIGFGGPAYPRGYFALNFGYPEPWEAKERPE